MAIQFVTDQFTDLNITTAKIADDGVTADKINLAAGTYAYTNGATLRWAKDPTLADDLCRKSYVDSVASGLDVKESVVCATTANITIATALNVGDAIDGITLADGDRVLVKDQDTGSQNGIYIAGASPARSDDFAAGSGEAGAFMFIEEGTLNGDNGFVCTNNSGDDVVGTDALVFTQFSGAGQITAGAALTKSGNTLNVAVDDSSIGISGDELLVKASGITNNMLAGSIDAGKLAGSIPNTKLSNSTVAFGGVSLALGGSDTTPAFDLTDATNYPTSSLTGTITNAQLAGTIGNDKLVALTTAGMVSVGAIDIDGATEMNSALADADLLIVDDGGAGTEKSMLASRIPTYVFSKVVGGDVLIDSAGDATIQTGSVTNAMLAGSIANSNLANSTMIVTDGNASTAISLGGTMTFTGTDFLEASGTISLATNAVTFAKLKVLPGITTASGNANLTAFTLGNEVDSTWYNAVMVYRNGQLQTKVNSFSNPTDSSEYTVTASGSDTVVTFGAAPLANEKLVMTYRYED